MITNYYTIRALIAEWHPLIVGLALEQAFSQSRDELTLAFAGDSAETMLRFSARAPMQYLFRVDGYSRARRNVAEFFHAAVGRSVTDLRIADRDRMVFVDLAGGLCLQIMLFGPRANAFLVSTRGIVQEAFQRSGLFEGEKAPASRPAAIVADYHRFAERWPTDRKTIERSLTAAMPLFDRTLAREAAIRAGFDPGCTPDLEENELRKLFESARKIESDAGDPQPRIYWDGREPVLFSLIPLSHVKRLREESFPTVDGAAGVYVRSALSRNHFRLDFDPLEKALASAAKHYRTRVGRMEDELARESRADLYERIGHLLMANPAAVERGEDRVGLEDLFAEERQEIEISIDPTVNAVENAERYYDRARRTRRAREEAARRLVETRELAERAESMLGELRRIEDRKEVRAFRRKYADELARFMPAGDDTIERVPFRRFELGNGYEVWVGRSAQQNDDLTFRHAQKFDLWMHARGTPGSHTVLRLPGRTAKPDPRTVQQAAAIAAYFSKARGSGLVPVIVAERKFVRKPRGAEPGVVTVDRENVILVKPELPS